MKKMFKNLTEQQVFHKLSPADAFLLKTYMACFKEVLTLKNEWKSKITKEEKMKVKKKVVCFINEKCEEIEKTAGFLNVISVPYVLSRLSLSIRQNVYALMDKYGFDIPKEFLNLQEKQERDVCNFMPDDLDLWVETKNWNKLH